MTPPDDPQTADRTAEADGAEEPRGLDRFPGGADPLFSPATHARMGKVAGYVFGGLIYAIVFAVLDQLRDDPFEWGLFGIRIVVFAIVLAVFDAIGRGYRGWRERRQRS